MTEHERSRLGERIRASREAMGMSLADLEASCGVTKGYLSQLERGEATNPSLEAVQKIAAGLGVRLSELLGEEREGAVRDLPPALAEFIERSRERGRPLSEEDVEMLLSVRRRGSRPTSAEDYDRLLDYIDYWRGR